QLRRPAVVPADSAALQIKRPELDAGLHRPAVASFLEPGRRPILRRILEQDAEIEAARGVAAAAGPLEEARPRVVVARDALAGRAQNAQIGARRRVAARAAELVEVGGEREIAANAQATLVGLGEHDAARDFAARTAIAAGDDVAQRTGVG